MSMSGEIMSQDRVVAIVRDDLITEIDERLAPIYLCRTVSNAYRLKLFL